MYALPSRAFVKMHSFFTSSTIGCLIISLASRSVHAKAIPKYESEPEANPTCRRTTVAVLGAGIAGITTAQALHNQSITDFLIVEYQGEIGGRVHHADFGQGPDGNPLLVEYGANWAQGLGTEGGPGTSTP